MTRILPRIRVLVNRYRLSSAERAFLEAVGVEAPDSRVAGVPVILVEAVEDHYYLALFAQIVRGIRRELPIRAEQFVSRSLRAGVSRSPLSAVKGAAYYNFFTDAKWVRLYGAFCERVGYRSAGAPIAPAALVDLIHAWRIWKKLASKTQLLEMTVDGVKIGDLVNDTYLRFKPAATVDLHNPYLWVVLWQALRDLRAARRYLVRAHPRMLLTTYSTYVQHGIAVRAALAAGVAVFSFGNYQEFAKRLRSDDVVHTRNPDHYRSGFALLPNPLHRLADADTALAARLTGIIDPATAYMARSAYAAGSSPLPPGLRGSIVMFLHDFYDSPHCYRWMIFADFWEWSTTTLQIARAAGIPVFVKPHPNQIFESNAIVRDLMERFPEAKLLPADISNVQIAAAGAACAVTVYGTVAHEMAYLGLPSIAAGHNPHISFEISRTAHSVEEYRDLIETCRETPFSRERLRRESLSFYYMHNLALAAEETELRDVIVAFRRLVVKERGELSDGAAFTRFDQQLPSLPGFRKACRDFAALLVGDPDDGAAALDSGPLPDTMPRHREDMVASE